jgi:hypothetical protein
MKLIQIYLDDETHTTLIKTYTIALAAAEESFTFEDYLVYLLQAVSPCLPTHVAQPLGKEKTIKVKQKILSFRGKEYLLQNSIIDLECNECGRLFRSGATDGRGAAIGATEAATGEATKAAKADTGARGAATKRVVGH